MWQKSKNIYHFFVSLSANIYYGFPGRKLVVIGVTGTSGKTTTAHMIYEILKNAGKKVSLLSSIKAVIGGKEYDTGFHVTTPDPQELPKYLKKTVDAGDNYFVLEVSSHALDQNRSAFIPFKVGVLTTLAHEHLDYHKTFENYSMAKFKLLKIADNAVIPEQLFSFFDKNIIEKLRKIINYDFAKEKTITFGLETGDETQEKWRFNLKIPGNYNVLNALAAASVGDILKIPHKTIKSSLENFTAIAGRFEEIKNTKGFRIIIDFAHKPDALKQVILTARKEVGKKGRVIVMYGCASQRDTLKRPIMGKISGKLAEISVLTDEDPRYEDPIKIINEIASGCVAAGAKEADTEKLCINFTNNVFFKIPDRNKAISFIINYLAKKGDIVLLCGKGHEKSMNYNGVEKPWNEYEVVKESLIRKQ